MTDSFSPESREARLTKEDVADIVSAIAADLRLSDERDMELCRRVQLLAVVDPVQEEKDDPCMCNVPEFVGIAGEPEHWRCLRCGKHPHVLEQIHVRLLPATTARAVQAEQWTAEEIRERHEDNRPLIANSIAYQLRQTRSTAERLTRDVNDLASVIEQQEMSHDTRTGEGAAAVSSTAGAERSGDAAADCEVHAGLPGQSIKGVKGMRAAAREPRTPQPADLTTIENDWRILRDRSWDWHDMNLVVRPFVDRLIQQLAAAARPDPPAAPPDTGIFERVLKARSATTRLRDFARQHGMDSRERDPLVLAIHASIDDAEGLMPAPPSSVAAQESEQA